MWLKAVVVSKCANPKCAAVLRYLHEGKLFEFEVRAFGGPSCEEPDLKHYQTLSREIECLWLCTSCALTLTLVRESHTDEIAIVPLNNGVERGGDVGDTVLPTQRTNAGSGHR